ncbi:MAG: heme transporter HemC, partial [Hyphomicrobiaceae bacterium]
LTALLALVGIDILPVIKFSVDWWYTLHQPSTRFTQTLDPVFRTPLLVMTAGFTLMLLAMHMKAMRNEILRRRVKAATIRAVERAGRADAPGPARTA